MFTEAEILNIRVTGTPLDDPDRMAAAAELFRAIGLAACSWSRLEVHLDMVLIYLNRPKHSAKLYDPDHPISLQSKLRLLKRWFNQHPALKTQTLEFRKLSPRLIELSQTRNTFLHSALQDYDPQTKSAVWRGIKPGGTETFSVGMHQGSLETLIQFAAAAHEAHVTFAKIGRDLFDAGMIAQLQKSGPQLPHPGYRLRRLRAGSVFGRPRRDRQRSSHWAK